MQNVIRKISVLSDHENMFLNFFFVDSKTYFHLPYIFVYTSSRKNSGGSIAFSVNQ